MTSISFNGVAVKKITKVNNGYIYEMEDYVETPKSLYELIEGLGDDYSIFREMIMSVINWLLIRRPVKLLVLMRLEVMFMILYSQLLILILRLKF